MVSSRTKKYTVNAAKFLFAAGILTWLFKSGKIDVSSIRLIMKPLPIAMGLLFATATYLFSSMRWRFLLISRGASISLLQAFRLSLIGLFFSFALPGGVSGDVVKAYYVSRGQKSLRWTTGISVIIDRYIGVTVMALMSFVTMLLDYVHVATEPKLYSTFLTIGALLIFLLLFGLIFFSSRVIDSGKVQRFLKKLPRGEKLNKLFLAGHEYGGSARLFITAGILSLISQVACVLMILYFGNVIGADLKWTTYFYCVPLGLMLTAIPISPGGVGVGQAAFYFLFNAYTGDASDLGPTLATLYQIFTFSLGVVGAVFYLQYKEEIPAKESVA